MHPGMQHITSSHTTHYPFRSTITYTKLTKLQTQEAASSAVFGLSHSVSSLAYTRLYSPIVAAAPLATTVPPVVAAIAPDR